MSPIRGPRPDQTEQARRAVQAAHQRQQQLTTVATLMPFPITAFPFLPPAPSSPAPIASAPAGVPPDVSVALASVPIAQDGNVINADYHNALRDAIIALASYIGEGALSQTLVLTLAPAFLAVPGSTAWIVSPEHASGTNGSTGWIPLDLPDGARLQTLAVSHTAQATMQSLTVQLERASVANASTTRLFRVARTSGDGTPKVDVASLEVSGVSGPAALDEFRQVDNSTYRYFVRATTTGPTPPAAASAPVHVDVHALQVFFTR